MRPFKSHLHHNLDASLPAGVVSPEEAKSRGLVRCDNGSVVALASRCDGVADCPGMRDERDCGEPLTTLILAFL